MGFCQLALFGGYAIYFPDCSRPGCGAPAPRSATTWAAWSRPRALSRWAYLTSHVFAGYPQPWPLRYAGRDDVLGLPARPAGPAVRPRDQGPAAAGVTASGGQIPEGRSAAIRD